MAAGCRGRYHAGFHASAIGLRERLRFFSRYSGTTELTRVCFALVGAVLDQESKSAVENSVEGSHQVDAVEVVRRVKILCETDRVEAAQYLGLIRGVVDVLRKAVHLVRCGGISAGRAAVRSIEYELGRPRATS